MRAFIKNISVLMIAVFAIFFCGNTIFIHSHFDQGHQITHSHPYIPGSTHSHSPEVLQFIAQANVFASSMSGAEILNLDNFTPVLLGIYDNPPVLSVETIDYFDYYGRDPPATCA